MFKVPVFYQPAQVAPMQGGVSPSAIKPKYAVESWLAKFGGQIEVNPSKPATREQLYAAHEVAYVDDVLACKAENGFGTKSSALAASLPYNVGSFMSAALEAVRNRKVAVSPTSGFHHAGWDHGGGFCTFNGLMVAAMELSRRGEIGGGKRLGILDCDMHYGNGTDDIIQRLALEDMVLHYTHGMPGYGYKDTPATFLATLPRVIRRFVQDGATVLFYQAGADPHAADRLGGFLSTDEMRARDRVVFETCESLGLPVVWNLAGGYQTVKGHEGADFMRPVLCLHDNTMEECLKVFGG